MGVAVWIAVPREEGRREAALEGAKRTWLRGAVGDGASVSEIK